VDCDHVYPDQLLGVADPLGHHVAQVRHELDAQPADPLAGVAQTEVVRDQPLLPCVKRPIHGEGRLEPAVRSHGRRVAVVRSGEEERVSLDLDQSHGRDRLEHRLEQTLGDLLRVSEVQLVKPHELRVSADVGKKKEHPLRHAHR
jgi:hypothetical protein